MYLRSLNGQYGQDPINTRRKEEFCELLDELLALPDYCPVCVSCNDRYAVTINRHCKTCAEDRA